MIYFNTILLKKNIPHKALINDNSYLQALGASRSSKYWQNSFFSYSASNNWKPNIGEVFLGHCQVLDKYVLFWFGPTTTTVGGVVCLKTGCLSVRMSGSDYGGKWVRCSFYLDPWHRTIVTIVASAQDINCYVYLWHGITIPPPVPGVPTCSAGLQNILQYIALHYFAVRGGLAFGTGSHSCPAQGFFIIRKWTTAAADPSHCFSFFPPLWSWLYFTKELILRNNFIIPRFPDIRGFFCEFHAFKKYGSSIPRRRSKNGSVSNWFLSPPRLPNFSHRQDFNFNTNGRTQSTFER